MATALLLAAIAASAPSGAFFAARKSLASGGDVLLAVNVDRGSITAQFDIHDLSDGSVAVMFEDGRSVAAANSSFTDSFESMDVHVYKFRG